MALEQYREIAEKLKTIMGQKHDEVSIDAIPDQDWDEWKKVQGKFAEIPVVLKIGGYEIKLEADIDMHMVGVTLGLSRFIEYDVETIESIRGIFDVFKYCREINRSWKAKVGSSHSHYHISLTRSSDNWQMVDKRDNPIRLYEFFQAFHSASQHNLELKLG